MINWKGLAKWFGVPVSGVPKLKLKPLNREDGYPNDPAFDQAAQKCLDRRKEDEEQAERFEEGMDKRLRHLFDETGKAGLFRLEKWSPEETPSPIAHQWKGTVKWSNNIIDMWECEKCGAKENSYAKPYPGSCSGEMNKDDHQEKR